MHDLTHDLTHDLRHAARLLARRPVLTALAAVSLALGIGVNSAIFTIVNAVLLRELPFAAGERVVDVYTSDGDGDFQYSASSYPDYRDLRDASGELFEELASQRNVIVTWDDGHNTELLFGEEVSVNFFDLVGQPFPLGRGFLDEEAAPPGGHPVVVLGHDFWRQRFGADPGVVGRTLDLNGLAFTVVGVAPEAFKGSFPAFASALFLPASMADVMSESPRLERRGSRSLILRGRLRPGVTIDAAQARLDVVAGRLAAEFPDTNEDRRITLVPTREVAINPGFDGPIFGVAGLLMGVVGLVLLIACSNIANLLLARAADRRREIALRLALGVGRWRLVRQLLLESTLLAFLGGALGLLLAFWASRLIVSFQPPLPIPLSLDLAIDLRVLLFTLGAAVLTGLVAGLAPALRASRTDLVAAIKNDAGAVRERIFGLRNALVVAQVTVSTVLLVGSGLFLRSLASAQSIDPGFDLDHGAAVSIALGFGSRYDATTGPIFFDQLLERVRALPEIERAAYVELLPLGAAVQNRGVELEGHPERRTIDAMSVGPGYFETLGIALQRGRELTDSDRPEAPPVVVVNDTLARQAWPGEDPIGQRLRFDDDDPWSEVVGVVETGRYRTLGEAPRPYLYTCHLQSYRSLMTLVATGPGAEGTILAAVRREMDAIDPRVPIFDQKLMSDHLELALFLPRMGAALLFAFGLLGLVLASVGLYGVVAYSVARRTREVGIRMAIGAARRDVLTLVVRQGMGLVACGLVLGLAAAFGASRLLGGLLYGVTPHDPLTFAGVAAVLAAVALVANLVPARRASRIDPIAALRYE